MAPQFRPVQAAISVLPIRELGETEIVRCAGAYYINDVYGVRKEDART